MTLFKVIKRIAACLLRVTGRLFITFLFFIIPSFAYPASLFQKDILGRPAIPQPSDPFVLIFFSGGSDAEPHYGFVTDGHMSQSDWLAVLNHVGYLSPYSIINLGSPDTWATFGQDIALRAAQSLGRPTGGSIAGLPKDRHQWKLLKKAYSETLSLRMTHIFQDAEPYLGTPGGNGMYRIEFFPGVLSSTLSTLAGDNISILSRAEKDQVSISFGACFDKYAFGGKTVILSERDEHDFSSNGKGWYIAFLNVGGSNGKNYIRIYSDGNTYVSSPPLTHEQADLWNTVHISVEHANKSGFLKTTVKIDGIGSSTGDLPTPTNSVKSLTLGNPRGERRTVSYDDLIITSRHGTATHNIAHYTFEPSKVNPPSNRSVVQIRDVSGNNHTLHIDAPLAADARYSPTTGINKTVFYTVKRADVSELLDARFLHGAAPPILLTNWRLNDRPGRFAAWKSAGFTNGSTEYYLYRNHSRNSDKILNILNRDSRRTRWAADDGSRWNHAWLGQVDNRNDTLTPDEYQTLVVLAVLDGNRWFSIFTAMSDGHLAPHDSSRRAKALANADVLYKLAQAASWYQPVSTGLVDSKLISFDQDNGLANTPILRARVNQRTKEMWFAGYCPCTASHRPTYKYIHLPTRNGTVINLTTNKKHAISSGSFKMPLNRHAVPFYFLPTKPK